MNWMRTCVQTFYLYFMSLIMSWNNLGTIKKFIYSFSALSGSSSHWTCLTTSCSCCLLTCLELYDSSFCITTSSTPFLPTHWATFGQVSARYTSPTTSCWSMDCWESLSAVPTGHWKSFSWTTTGWRGFHPTFAFSQSFRRFGSITIVSGKNK